MICILHRRHAAGERWFTLTAPKCCANKRFKRFPGSRLIFRRVLSNAKLSTSAIACHDWLTPRPWDITAYRIDIWGWYRFIIVLPLFSAAACVITIYILLNLWDWRWYALTPHTFDCAFSIFFGQMIAEDIDAITLILRFDAGVYFYNISTLHTTIYRRDAR